MQVQAESIIEASVKQNGFEHSTCLSIIAVMTVKELPIAYGMMENPKVQRKWKVDCFARVGDSKN